MLILYTFISEMKFRFNEFNTDIFERDLSHREVIDQEILFWNKNGSDYHPMIAQT